MFKYHFHQTSYERLSYQRHGGQRGTERVCSAEMSFSLGVTVNCAQLLTISAVEESS